MKSEGGWAMPITIGVLAAVALFAGFALLGAQNVAGTADEDRRDKRALAAAEAGLQVAAYRVSNLRPDPTRCMVGAAPAAPVAGECAASAAQSNGPGSSFTYYVTPALPAGASCADLPTIPAAPVGSTDHCITSVGVAGGVTRRVQSRVRVIRGGLFSQIGLIGLDFLTLVNSIKVYSDGGSNGPINGDNSVEFFGDLIIPDSAPQPTVNGSSPDVIRRPDEWALPQVDFASSHASNNNALLPRPTSVQWNATTREYVMTNSVEITITGGTYNVCEFYADNSVKINISGTVRLFVDSPLRAGSGCAASTGRFCLDNSVSMNENTKDATKLEVYVYGAPDNHCASGRPGVPFDGTEEAAGVYADSDVVMGNSVKFYGTLYAPNSQFRGMNSIMFEGGLAAKSVIFANSLDFKHPDSLKNAVPAPGPIQRLSWTECRSRPTVPSDPESGCS